MLLGDLAPGIKCRNAGASYLSIDLPFEEEDAYRRAIAAIGQAQVALLYGVQPQDVQIYAYDPAMAIKITIPRLHWNGGIEETDFDGAQQFAPLLDIEIP